MNCIFRAGDRKNFDNLLELLRTEFGAIGLLLTPDETNFSIQIQDITPGFFRELQRRMVDRLITASYQRQVMTPKIQNSPAEETRLSAAIKENNQLRKVRKVFRELPEPIETKMADVDLKRARKNQKWLVIRDHTWEFILELAEQMQWRLNGSGIVRCLELLHNNGWLSHMELHMFGGRGLSSIMFALQEVIRPATEEDPEGEKAILDLSPHMFTVDASFQLGKVFIKPPENEDFPFAEEDEDELDEDWDELGMKEDGNMLREVTGAEDDDEDGEGMGTLEADPDEHEGPSIVKTNHPATLEFWLRQTPFSLFRS